MSIETELTKDFSLNLPITPAAKATAHRFAQQQPNPSKAEQVYRNTLAVLTVNDYLSMLGIRTDLEHSHSWNPVVRLAADVADLKVPDLGTLECRPVKPNVPTCYIPYEVWDDRTGYVMVAIADITTNPTEATLLGFLPAVSMTETPIASLHPLENLLEHLATVGRQVEQSTIATDSSSRSRVNLSEWLQGQVTEGWRSVQYFLSPDSQEFAFNFRGDAQEQVPATGRNHSSSRHGKLLNLGMKLGEQQVVLIVEIKATTDNRFRVFVQVHPASGSLYLPTGLTLTILDAQAQTFLQAEAREADNFVKLSFRGTPGEEFSTRIALENTAITEFFKI